MRTFYRVPFAGKQPTSFRGLTSVLITALCSLNKRCLAMENTAKGKEGEKVHLYHH